MKPSQTMLNIARCFCVEGFMLVSLTSLFSSCNNNNFSGSYTSSLDSQEDAQLTQDNSGQECSTEQSNALKWSCNPQKTICSKELPLPDESSWECTWSSKEYSCQTLDHEFTSEDSCTDQYWTCSDQSSGELKCSLAKIPIPDHGKSPRANWSCAVNSDHKLLTCESPAYKEDSKPEEKTPPDTAGQSAPSTSTPITTSTTTSTSTGTSQQSPDNTCKDFSLEGTWSGTWISSVPLGRSGTYTVTFTQTAPGQVSGPLKVTGTPCGGSEVGSIKGSYKSDCSLEFTTDSGGGAIGNDSRSYCRFTWKGKMNPATNSGEGSWNAGGRFSGKWSGKKQ